MTTTVIPLPTGGSSFCLDSSSHPALPGDWSIAGSPSYNGMAHGMTIATLNSGKLSAIVLPARGMGLWKIHGSGYELGWKSPVRHGPIHPAYVNASRRGAIGWLDGFDELLCRCGLAFNGPPGKDDDGREITLHGRIANLPAWKLEAHLTSGSSPTISLVGIVDECALFDTCLRLTTTYTMTPESSILQITDTVENLGASPAEFQLLYHLNIGIPFLEPGSKAHVRFREMAPQTPRAAEGINSWHIYEAPATGFAEQVYLFRPEPDALGNGLAVLERPDGNAALAVRFPVANLPCFTLWKNTGALEDGFVTGLEPATGFPNFKPYERKQQRIPTLAPGGIWKATWCMELASNRTRVQELVFNTNCTGTVFPQPSLGYSPQGERSQGVA